MTTEDMLNILKKIWINEYKFKLRVALDSIEATYKGTAYPFSFFRGALEGGLSELEEKERKTV